MAPRLGVPPLQLPRQDVANRQAQHAVKLSGPHLENLDFPDRAIPGL